MIARSQPVGLAPKPKPASPETTDSDIERLRKLREALRRHLTGATRVAEEMAKIEERLEERAA